MTCPIPFETLVRYWSCDLSPVETDAVDEHVFACSRCADASAGVAAYAQGIHEMLPPVVVGRDLARAQARGLRTVANDIPLETPRETKLPRDADVLVHRLVSDLSQTEVISLGFANLDGSFLFTLDDVPFDPAEGAVLVACPRAFVDRLPRDLRFLVGQRHRNGQETLDRYTVTHRIE